MEEKKFEIQVARDEAVSQTWHLPTQDVSTSLIIESKNIKKVKKDITRFGFCRCCRNYGQKPFFLQFLRGKKGRLMWHTNASIYLYACIKKIPNTSHNLCQNIVTIDQTVIVRKYLLPRKTRIIVSWMILSENTWHSTMWET